MFSPAKNTVSLLMWQHMRDTKEVAHYVLNIMECFDALSVSTP